MEAKLLPRQARGLAGPTADYDQHSSNCSSGRRSVSDAESAHSDFSTSDLSEHDPVKMETLDEIDALKKDLNSFPWLLDTRARRGGEAVYMDKYNHVLPPGPYMNGYRDTGQQHPALYPGLDPYPKFAMDASPDQINYIESTVSTSVGSIEDSQKYKTKQTKDKICLVCGDKALGYNFNAISCESCKAFFRRNAFKEIRGRCEGKCEVTVESRSYCKKCRLKKCFTVGMKKELILNNEQKVQRREKIRYNRSKRQGVPYAPLPEEPEEHTSQNSPNGSSCSSDAGGSLSHIIASEVDPDVLDELDEHTKHRIATVMKAFRLSFDAPVNYDPKATPSSTDFLNMADASVRRLVKMAKHLDTFQALQQDDQITLLKGAVVEVLILRSSKMFDSGSMAWQVQSKEGEAKKVSAMGLQFGNGDNMQFFQQYQRFTSTLLTSTMRDNVVLMIMIVMTLLSPDRGNLTKKEEVMEAQEEYANILREYCEKRYPKEKLMFAKIIQKLADIREINETHTKMLSHMKVDELGPLIVEIFNLSAR